MVCGARGSIQFDFFHGFAVRNEGRVSRVRKILRPFTATAKLFSVASANLVDRAIHGETAYPGLRHLIKPSTLQRVVKGLPRSHPTEAIAVATARDFILAAALSETDEE